MKKKVLSIILVLAVAVGVIVLRPSFGWISPGDGGGKSQQLDIGKFKYNFEGGLHAAYIDESSTQYAAPGENLIYVDGFSGSLKAYNFSTIPTNLRVRIDYSYWNGSSLETVPYSNVSNDFEVKDDSGVLLKDSAYWHYDDSTKCWDYVDNPLAPEDTKYDIPAYIEPTTASTTTGETTTEQTTSGETTTAEATGELITLISHLGYSKDLTAGNPYEYKNVKIKLTVEVKQADYVTWQKIYEDYYPGG